MPWKDAAKRRAWEARRADERREARLHCPDCGQRRRTPETLQAHRGIAHGIHPEQAA